VGKEGATKVHDVVVGVATMKFLATVFILPSSLEALIYTYLCIMND